MMEWGLDRTRIRHFTTQEEATLAAAQRTDIRHYASVVASLRPACWLVQVTSTAGHMKGYLYE